MDTWKKFVLLVIFLSAMKMGWQAIPSEVPVHVDVIDELQSLWEVEAINSAKPFQYHLQIDN